MTEGQRPGTPGMLALAAGILAVAGAAMHWVRFRFPVSASTETTRYIGHASVGLFFGVLLLLRGVSDFMVRGRARLLPLPIVSGGFILGFAAYDLLTERSRTVAALVEAAERVTHLPASQAADLVHRQMVSGAFTVSFLPGLYLSIVAGFLAVAAGTVALWGRPGGTPGLPEADVFPAPPSAPRPGER